jgi:glycosidase
MKKIFFSLLLLLSASTLSLGQTIDRMEPPFWWAGMNNPELQLMAYGPNIGELQVSLENYSGAKLTSVTRLENPNYLVIDLILSPEAKPGNLNLLFKKSDKTVISHSYELKQRREGSAMREGFNTSDVMYLITPDRFANGDPDNDTVEGLKEKANRKFKGGRHGGDIKGILDNLDYIKEMGFTAIWVNPVLENDMERFSYHGYSTTDFYRVDSRFGTNEDYQELSRKAKEMGIKLIMDMIVNHNGSEHWWMKDLPASDWVNYQKEFLDGEYKITSHRKSTIQDPYVSQKDLDDYVDGWFVPTMPDLNQNNPYMATYLTQNSIWWVEYADLAGIRMDTYSYPEQDYMTEWTCDVMAEYPHFNIVGEEWNLNPSIVAYWQKGKQNPNGYTSCLPSLMDFPLQSGVVEGLNEKETNFSGWIKTYERLANDFIYADPMNMVIFPDNHDMQRFYSQVNEDFDLFKLGITYFLTVRGVPQIYYGTEILMTSSSDHGIVRSDFPGGWAGDKVNAFTGKGLSAKEKEAQDFFKTLLNWRKNNAAVHNGKLMHFNPKEGVYVLFRYTDREKVMVVLSKNDKAVSLDLSRFSEVLSGQNTQGKEILSGRDISLKGSLEVPAMTPMVIEIK